MSKNRKFNPDDIDEDFIINAMQNPRKEKVINEENNISKPDSIQAEAKTELEESPKVEIRKKRNKAQDYESTFIKNPSIIAREGRSIYITKEQHTIISKIVQSLGHSGIRISLSDYVYNLIANHLETYEHEIFELYGVKIKE